MLRIHLDVLQEVAHDVLNDVAPEFASMQAVLGKVDEFKRRFPPQYSSAYMSESLPALVSVYVRLELLSWDPLFGEDDSTQAAVTGQAFMEHAWFKQLIDFSSGMLSITCVPSHMCALCFILSAAIRSLMCRAN